MLVMRVRISNYELWYGLFCFSYMHRQSIEAFQQEIEIICRFYKEEIEACVVLILL